MLIYALRFSKVSLGIALIHLSTCMYIWYVARFMSYILYYLVAKHQINRNKFTQSKSVAIKLQLDEVAEQIFLGHCRSHKKYLKLLCFESGVNIF